VSEPLRRSADPMTAADELTVSAPAKLNLTLAVRRRRDDGFHEIESLVVAVTLFDELTIASRPEPGIELVCDNNKVPCDSRNLIHRAAVALAAAGGVTPAVRIHLRKRVPIGAGLGGGSSDAAATLIGLNRRWRLGYDTARLAEIGATIGSDVPLFFHLPAAIIRGRGERVTPVSFAWPGWYVLILPALAISTAEVYRRWRPGTTDMPQTQSALAAEDQPADCLSAALGNMLEAPAFAYAPALADLRARVQAACPLPVRLTGSGSGMFTLFDQRPDAERFAQKLRQELERPKELELQPASGPRFDSGVAIELVQAINAQRV